MNYAILLSEMKIEDPLGKLASLGPEPLAILREMEGR